MDFRRGKRRATHANLTSSLLKETATRLEERIDRLDAKIDDRFERLDGRLQAGLAELRRSLDTKFIWIVTTMIAFGAALLATMAEGFHWLK